MYWALKYNEIPRANLIQISVISHCYQESNNERRFHGIWNNSTVKVEMKPIPIQLIFQVVDDEDSQPLPDVNIEVVADFNGEEQAEKYLSTPHGNFILNGMPKCGEIEKMRLSLDGYHPDSLMNVSIENTNPTRYIDCTDDEGYGVVRS